MPPQLASSGERKKMIKVSLPQKPKYGELGPNLARIEIEACYPGYGTTLGNTLRRILLSSLTGTAVTSIKIKGLSHEFSTIPGIKEDVIQMILNLKKVRFRSFKDEPVKLTLKGKGVKKITAADIQCPADVEVVNREMPIAEITDKKAELEMEIEVKKGLGYVPVEQQERERKEIGLIAVDAIFTPVRRVNYTVENMRVGKRTDFDKITLEVETDGTITPQDAYEQAVVIAIEQYEAVKSFVSEEKAEVVAGKEELGGGEIKPVQEKRETETEEGAVREIGAMGFSTRTMNVLEKNGIKTMDDLAKLNEEELKKMGGMGNKGVKEIKKAIGNFGITLKS